MFQIKGLLLATLLFTGVGFAQQSYAQSTEERFNDLFITAGYSTAFGAALGAAALVFAPDPMDLHYVAVGASLGFIGGSILGTYLIFSPMLVTQDKWQSSANITAHHASPNNNTSARFSLRPVFHTQKRELVGMLARWKIFTF